MNEYVINDEFGYNKEYDYLNKVIEHTLKKLNITNSYFSIIFIDDEKMHELNLKYRNIDRTTDVLSFALEDNQKIKMPIRELGDVFISIPMMQKQAHDYEHSEMRELSFLCVHGLLHLLGYDHTRSKEDEEVHFGLQNDILNELNIIL